MNEITNFQGICFILIPLVLLIIAKALSPALTDSYYDVGERP